MGPFFGDAPGADSSLPFAYLNAGKRSLTLNLKSGAGRDILRSLLSEADLLVENFAPRVMPSLGLDYAALREISAPSGYGVHFQFRADRTLPRL